MPTPTRSGAIPKTRRVQRTRKLANAPIPRSLKPKQAVVATDVRVQPMERPYNPALIEELELEWFGYDCVLDDRRLTVPRLRPINALLALLPRPEGELEVPQVANPRPRFSALRIRLLPKLPASSDDLIA